MRRGGGKHWLARSGALAALATLGLVVATSPAGAAQGPVVKSTQYGFSFRLPANWKSVPLDGSDVTALLNAATHDDPSLTNALNSEVKSAASQSMKVFAIGPVTGAVTPNVNVIVSSSAGAPGGTAFAQAASAEAKIELSQIGAGHLKASIVNNSLGKTAVVTYRLNLKGQSEYGEQIYALHKSHIDIVTVTTSSAASSQAALQLITNSWKWSS